MHWMIFLYDGIYNYSHRTNFSSCRQLLARLYNVLYSHDACSPTTEEGKIKDREENNLIKIRIVVL